MAQCTAGIIYWNGDIWHCIRHKGHWGRHKDGRGTKWWR